MKKNFKNFDIFFKSVISNKKVFYQNNKSISGALEPKFNNDNNFIFEKKSLFLFNSKGNIIFSEPELLNNEYKDIINNIPNKIGKYRNKNGNKIDKNIFFNILFIGEKDKIVYVKIGNIDIISLGVFSINTRTSIIRLYLLNFLILFINYIEEDIDLSSNFDINNIQINIFKEFLFSPFHQYYLFLIKQLYQKHSFKLKNISYKNYYLIELNTNQIIFSYESLYNNNENIWNEILYHCHILQNNYINQYSLNFREDNYENYFAFFELKSTYPRRTFLIRFLPVLNGLGLIHEFVQDKLCSNDGNESNHYKEYESIYGYLNEINTLSQKTCNTTQSKFMIFKNDPICLKKINNYFIGSLSLKNKQKYLFSWKNHNNIYICEEIMNNINILIKNDQLNDNNIIRDIENKLNEEYQKEIKMKNDIDLNIYNNNNLFYNNNSDNYLENIASQKIDLTITKLFILMVLFNNTSKISRVLSSQKDLTFLKENSLSKRFHSSKKVLNKLSDILNENISENIGSYNFSNNKLLKENISFKTSNFFDSKNNNLNIEKSCDENNLFDINISIIQNKENITNNIDNNRNIEEEQKFDELNYEDLDSKNEFFDGEKINKIK